MNGAMVPSRHFQQGSTIAYAYSLVMERRPSWFDPHQAAAFSASEGANTAAQAKLRNGHINWRRATLAAMRAADPGAGGTNRCNRPM